MMLVTLLALMVTVTTLVEGQRCVNSCCQKCASPDHCRACYALNTNPVMCPCVGDEDAEKVRGSLRKVITDGAGMVSLSWHNLIRGRHSRNN